MVNPEKIVMVFSTFFVLLMAALILTLPVRRAHPHDLGDGLQQWYEAQSVPGGPKQGQSCCNQADMVNADADRREGQYWARFCPNEKTIPCVDWQPVPNFLIIRGGRNISPVVWYGIDWKDQSKGEKPYIYIRCFSPGLES